MYEQKSAFKLKSILLSNSSRKESTVGEMVNLMSVNTSHLNELSIFISHCWGSPVVICVALFMLLTKLGISVLAGFFVIIVLIPITAKLTNKSSKDYTVKLKYQDSRIKTINQVLNGIKMIKLNAWEVPFSKIINKKRVEEMRILKEILLLNVAKSISFVTSPILVNTITYFL